MHKTVLNLWYIWAILKKSHCKKHKTKSARTIEIPIHKRVNVNKNNEMRYYISVSRSTNMTVERIDE